MEHNNYTWFITQTVEAMLPRWHDRELVLTMKIDMSWTDHGYAKDGNTKIRDESTFRRTMFLAFHRPMNYTKVLGAEIPQDVKDKAYRLIPMEDSTVRLKQFSDHDSCWRHDGFNWVFKSFTDAWSFFEDKGLETVDTRRIDPQWHYSIFRGSPEYWMINKLEPVDGDPDKRFSTDYEIEFNRRIKLDEISKFMVKAQM